MKEVQQGKSKHQHWVPQFYLRYFATHETRDSAGAQAWILDKTKERAEAKLTAVRNVCGKRYLYAPIRADGVRDWSLDEKLDRLESDTATIWPRLSSGTPSLADATLREQLARFVAVMHLRNLQVFDTIDRIIDLRTQLWGPLSNEALTNRRPDQPDATDSGRYFAQVLQNDADRMTKTFAGKRWLVACANEDVFATTDRPVAFMHKSGKKAGPGTEGGVALFPLSPRRILVMDDKHGEVANEYRPVDAPNARPFNAALWQQCLRFLIAGRRPEIDALGPSLVGA